MFCNASKDRWMIDRTFLSWISNIFCQEIIYEIACILWQYQYEQICPKTVLNIGKRVHTAGRLIYLISAVQARARLNTLMVAKPDKGKQVEAMLCQMAQTGQLGGKLGDDELKGLLDRMSSTSQQASKVKFDRRRAGLDSDDEDLEDL